MKKNTIKVIAYVFISLTVLLLAIKVYAVTEEELKNKKNEIENEIENTNTELAGIKDKMTTNLEQINRLNVQINESEEALDDANEKLNELTEKVEKSKKEKESAQNEYEKQKEILNNRLIAIYESSKTTYLDVLVGSTSLSNFFTRYYMLEELSEYDHNLIRNLEAHASAVSIKTNIEEENQKEAQNLKDTIEAKNGALEVLLEDKKNLVENLSQEEIELNQQLEQFEIDKKEVEKELIEIARQNALKKSLIPSKSGYISPLLGKTKVNITTGYYGYSGHTGVDFAVPLGTDVVSVKDGTVVISRALKNSNGVYRSYGEYIVIDHHDGTMTLYAHGLPNSRIVNPR